MGTRDLFSEHAGHPPLPHALSNPSLCFLPGLLPYFRPMNRTGLRPCMSFRQGGVVQGACIGVVAGWERTLDRLRREPRATSTCNSPAGCFCGTVTST